MADSASELESDASSIDGSQVVKMPSPEQMQKRIQSLQQENTVLKMELETFKLKCKNLQEENKELRKASVNIVSPLGIIPFTCDCYLFYICHSSVTY